jgi:hypothetical protein
MRIKVYIVTFNDAAAINTNIASLFNSDFAGHDVSIHVINNHSNFHLNPEFVGRVEVLHNQTRSDLSRGHLSRNWNQAIINGFKDLNNPDCDILVTCQDDTSWDYNWVTKLLNIHKTYTFYSGVEGDCVCSYLPEAVKRIGLWDERFNGICFQEADYFTRAYIYNKDKSSINDLSTHGRELNPTYHIAHKTAHYRQHNGRSTAHDYCYELLKLKWGHINPNWTQSDMSLISNKSAIQDFMYYPFFEKDVDLFDKNYFINENRSLNL